LVAVVKDVCHRQGHHAHGVRADQDEQGLGQGPVSGSPPLKSALCAAILPVSRVCGTSHVRETGDNIENLLQLWTTLSKNLIIQ
jgi:hypothetical protein